MRFIFIYIVILNIIPELLQAQELNNKDRITISGIVYDEKSNERIPFAHIIDITRKKGTNADDNGNFTFSTLRGDSLKFTAIGYNDHFVYLADTLLNNSYIVITLKPKTYMLQGLDYYANDPMKGFYLRDIERDTIRIYGSKGMPGAGYWNGGTPTGGSGYVTAFANLFNKHAKQEKKLSQILAEEALYKQQEEIEVQNSIAAKGKYSPELVQWITNLQGDDLSDFITLYKPSKNFILRATDYDIALQIVESFREFQYERGLEVDVEEILKRAKFKD